MRGEIRSRARIGAVLGVAALALTACGSGPQNPSAGPTSEATGGGSGEVATVRFWQNEFDSVDNDWYAARVKEFNQAHDNIQIDYQVIADGAWDQSLKSAQAAGTTPDLYTMSYNTIQPKVRAGELAPITGHIAAEAWNDIQPAVLDSITVNGERYAYPFYLEPGGMLIYRADLFQQVGLDPDNPPTTWADLISAGEKLKQTDLVPLQTAATAVELGWTTWGQQMNAAGHLPISDDWSTSLADDPAYTQLFQLYQDLYSKEIVAQQPLASYGDIAPFGQGQVAVAVNGSWAVSVLLSDYTDLVDDVRIAPLPAFDGDQTKPTTTMGGWALGVDAKSAHVDEAAAVVSFFLAEDVARPKAYFEAAKYTKFSPRVSVAQDITANADTSANPWYEVMANDIVPYQILEPTYSWDVSLAFGTALEEAMRGTEVSAAQAGVHKEIQRVIDTQELASQK
ncbi:MAG: extracellular solute-binding protein [Propionicimonas sp.]